MTPAGVGVVGLSVGGPRPAELDELIHAIGRRYTVVNVDGHVGPIDWMLVFRSPSAIPPGIPAVWFLADADDAGQVQRPALLLSPQADLLAACPTTAPKLLTLCRAEPTDRWAPFAPYPRERIRRARGLPGSVVGEATEGGCRWDGQPVGDHLRDTILTAASAVIVDESTVVPALALAAPMVTDPLTAAAYGAEHDVQLLVGDDLDERRRLAAGLAADTVTAARLSWAARTLFERSHSWPHLIQRIARAVTPLTGPLDRIDRVFDELGTPEDAPIRARAARLYHFPDFTRAPRNTEAQPTAGGPTAQPGKQ